MARLTISPPVAVVVASGKLLTISNTLTLAGTDGTTMTFPATSTTVAGLSISNAFSVAQTITDSVNVANLTLTSTHITSSAPLVITASAITGGSLIYAETTASTTNSSFAGLWLDLAHGSGTAAAGLALRVDNNTVTKFSVDPAGNVVVAGSLTVGSGARGFDATGNLALPNKPVGTITGTATLGKIPALETTTAQSGWLTGIVSGVAVRVPYWADT